jgi:hypothetical protein
MRFRLQQVTQKHVQSTWWNQIVSGPNCFLQNSYLHIDVVTLPLYTQKSSDRNILWSASLQVGSSPFFWRHRDTCHKTWWAGSEWNDSQFLLYPRIHGQTKWGNKSEATRYIFGPSFETRKSDQLYNCEYSFCLQAEVPPPDPHFPLLFDFSNWCSATSELGKASPKPRHLPMSPVQKLLATFLNFP